MIAKTLATPSGSPEMTHQRTLIRRSRARRGRERRGSNPCGEMLHTVDCARGMKLFLVMVMAAGCAGAQFTLDAKSAAYPLSMSPTVPGPDGALLRIGAGLEKVGDFTFKKRAWGLLYSAIALSDMDVSSSANTQIKAAAGDAIVNLELVSLEHCVLNYLFPFSILPIWPGCQNATYRGDIVALQRAVAP